MRVWLLAGRPDDELPAAVLRRSSDENELRCTPSRSEAAELARLLFWWVLTKLATRQQPILAYRMQVRNEAGWTGTWCALPVMGVVAALQAHVCGLRAADTGGAL